MDKKDLNRLSHMLDAAKAICQHIANNDLSYKIFAFDSTTSRKSGLRSLGVLRSTSLPMIEANSDSISTMENREGMCFFSNLTSTSTSLEREKWGVSIDPKRAKKAI